MGYALHLCSMGVRNPKPRGTTWDSHPGRERQGSVASRQYLIGLPAYPLLFWDLVMAMTQIGCGSSFA